MNQLGFDGLLFYLFWGSALMVAAGIVLAVLERGDDGR